MATTKHATHKSVRSYLKVVSSPTMRSKVRSAMRRRCGGVWDGLNFQRREYLHDSIFEVVNELESREPDHPMVEPLFDAMNMVDDDMGWNDA